MDESTLMSIVNSPVNLLGVTLCLALLGASIYVLRGWMRSSQNDEQEDQKRKRLPKMKKRDFYVKELIPYNGQEDERILIAVNSKVFDVSNRGRDFYGPGGPYHCFAGKDASRGLATMSLEPSSIKDEYDDLSDLNSSERDQLREWENQMKEKYEFVGRLLRPDESPKEYSDTEESSGVQE
ncbi:membrane-associated progesterone receptor component 1-like [Convolutriloba macropyga]|uniref:membrane-associated progesterone receptor component 1-like n=1 Tax=Convolutriloba macropyga TaxID=536237 RepID=UPI003F5279BC